MKKFGLLIIVFVFFISTLHYPQIFTQSFNLSSTLTDYFSDPPSTDQFRVIGVSGGGATIDIVSNSLVMTRNSGNSAYAERNYNFLTLPAGLLFQFDFSVSGTHTAATNAFYVYVGADVANTAGNPSNANIYARFSINTTANSNEFQIRDITNSATSPNIYTGTQRITWVLNNTGGVKNYLGPNGINQNIDDDKADIWVGTNLEFENVNVQTITQNILRFKFLASSWTNGTTFSIDNIYVDDENALPVELTSFSASTIGSSVKLSWNTATEINNYGFEIERASLSASPLPVWEKIGFVNGNGNSNSPKDYSFVDDNVTAGKPAYRTGRYSYRLKQIDNDGQFEYSKTIEVDMNGVKKFELSQNYPNPFNPATTISFNLPEAGNVKLTLFDILGQEIKTLVNEFKESGVHTINFNASELNSGMYIYKIESNGLTQTRKMTLIK